VTAAILPGIRDHEVRAGAAGMIAIAAVYPALPVHPSVSCPLRAVTGIPCPFCGMTRAVIAAAHGHVGTSLAFNPGGMVVLALALVALFRPQWLTRLRLPWWSFAVVFGVLWVWNVGFNPTFHQLLLR
jgi:membrane-associated PAP2 superfamily phosphatase